MTDRKDLVVWTPDTKHIYQLEPGESVQAAYDRLPLQLRSPSMQAFRAGKLIPRSEWSTHYLYEGDHITFGVVPGGGGGSKGVIGIIAGIASIVVGAVTGQAWLVQLGAGLLLSGIGTMLIKPPSLNSNMSDSTRDSAYYGITGQSNEAKPYAVVPKLYGMHKIYPLIATAPIIRNSGTVSRIFALYDFGVGMYNITNLRIGETPAETFNPQLIFHWNEQHPNMQLANSKVNADQLQYVLQQNQPLILESDNNASFIEIDLAFAKGLAYYNDAGNPTNTKVSFRVQYRAVGSSTWIGVGPSAVSGIAATYLNGESNTSGPVNFIDPQGYVTIQGKNEITRWHWRGVTYTTPNPPDGTNGYTNITLSKSGNYNSSLGGYPLRVQAIQLDTAVSGFMLTGASAKPIVAAILIGQLAAGRYEVRLERLDPISTSTRRMDEATITQNKTFIYGTVVNLRAPHTMLEMGLVGSEKLSGVVQNLSAWATSVLPIYDQWGNQIAFEATRNHAWICLDALLGPCNPRPLSPGEIDFPSWRKLADYCDEQHIWNVPGGQIIDNRFNCDVVIDYETTIQEFVDSVLSSCHATRNITVDGKWGVTIDEKDYFTPRQLITPANSWNFTGRRIFPQDTHAFKVSFIDAFNEYQKQEIIVYRDGYDQNNATKFENLGTIGITTVWHAWSYGRYMFAQAISRQESFTVTMDVENLVVQRGDGVMVQHDVPKIGGFACRVIAGGHTPIPAQLGGPVAPGNNIQGYPVLIAAELGVQPEQYTVRRRDGSVSTGVVYGMPKPNVLILDNSLDIYNDDLIVVGKMDQVTEQYIVLGVTPGQDMTATLTLCRYDPDMYDSDSGPLPEWDPTFGTDVINHTDLAIVSTNVQSSVRYVDRKPVQTWLITFTVNRPSVYGYTEAFLLVPGMPERRLGRVNGYSLQFEASLLDSDIAVARYADVRLEPYTPGGLKGKTATVRVTTTPDLVKPGTVKNFAVNVQSETIVMFWELQSDVDVWQHEIRYHPDPVDGTWERAQQIGIYDWWVTTANCGARTGKYFIRSVDSSGNLSDILWQRTTIQTLPDIDIIDHMVDLLFTGQYQDMYKNADGKPQLSGDLGEVVPTGYYFLNRTVDLGDIYEVRVSSKILGHAISSYSFMSEWIPISNQRPLASGYSGYWNIALEYRASNVATMMADWVPLSNPNADPIGDSPDDAWTDWRGIQVGDVTGRFIQFRIRANSLDPNISVIIDTAAVDVDVKERRWFYDDFNVPVAGAHVTYNPAFQQVPTLAITINGGTATRYEVSNKDKYGFDIKLFNGSTAVSGYVDIAAIGYGKEKSTII